MSNVKKMAISVPQDLARAIRTAAAQQRVSVSGWLAEAAARRLRRRTAIRALKSYEAEFGEIGEGELEAIDRWLGISSD